MADTTQQGARARTSTASKTGASWADKEHRDHLWQAVVMFVVPAVVLGGLGVLAAILAFPTVP